VCVCVCVCVCVKQVITYRLFIEEIIYKRDDFSFPVLYIQLKQDIIYFSVLFVLLITYS